MLLKRFVPLLLSLSLGMALAACGTKDATESAPPVSLPPAAATPTPTPEPTPTPIPAITQVGLDEAVASCLYTQIPESRINTELF